MTQLNLQDELLDHLAVEESALFIFKENLSPEVLPSECEDERQVLTWTLAYIRQYGSAPGPVLLENEFGIEFAKPEMPVNMLVEKLRERHKKNETKKTILEASKAVSEDPEHALSLLETSVSKIKADTTSDLHTLTDSDWDASLSEYRAKIAAGMLKGKSFGFEAMDLALGGLRKSTLTYVVARPKRYKSWLLLKSAVENRLLGERVSFFSLELSEQEMFGRYQCMMAGVSWSRFQHGKLLPEEYKMMEEQREILAETEGAFFCHRPDPSERTVRDIQRLAKEDEATFVLIDQLSWLKHTEKVRADLRHAEIGLINKDLKIAADDFPIYIAAQFNREADSLQEMADLSKIGLSDSIGQDADMILGVYRNKQMAQNNLIQFGSVDSRGFEGGKWEIKVELTQHTNFRLLGEVDED